MGVHMRYGSLLIRMMASLLIVWPAGVALAVEAGVLSGHGQLGGKPHFQVDLQSSGDSGFSVIRPGCLQALWQSGSSDAESIPLAVDILKRTDQRISLRFAGQFLLDSTEGKVVLRSSCPLNLFELTWPVFIAPSDTPDQASVLKTPLDDTRSVRDFEPRSLANSPSWPVHTSQANHDSSLRKAETSASMKVWAPVQATKAPVTNQRIEPPLDVAHNGETTPNMATAQAPAVYPPKRDRNPMEATPTNEVGFVQDWPVFGFVLLGLSVMGALTFAVWWRGQSKKILSKSVAEPTWTSCDRENAFTELDSPDLPSTSGPAMSPEPGARGKQESQSDLLMLRSLISADAVLETPSDYSGPLHSSLKMQNTANPQEEALRHVLRFLEWASPMPWNLPDAYHSLVSERNRTMLVGNSEWPKWIQWHVAFVELAHHEAKHSRRLSMDTALALLERLGGSPSIDAMPEQIPDVLVSQISGKLFEMGSAGEQSLFVDSLCVLEALEAGDGSIFCRHDFHDLLMQHAPSAAI